MVLTGANSSHFVLGVALPARQTPAAPSSPVSGLRRRSRPSRPVHQRRHQLPVGLRRTGGLGLSPPEPLALPAPGRQRPRGLAHERVVVVQPKRAPSSASAIYAANLEPGGISSGCGRSNPHVTVVFADAKGRTSVRTAPSRRAARLGTMPPPPPSPSSGPTTTSARRSGSTSASPGRSLTGLADIAAISVEIPMRCPCGRCCSTTNWAPGEPRQTPPGRGAARGHPLLPLHLDRILGDRAASSDCGRVRPPSTA